MAIAESMLPEFDRETATTRLLLERVPEEKSAWRPHARSRSLGDLAVHIATILQWAPVTLEGSEFDINPLEGQAYEPPEFRSVAGVLGSFDEAVRTARTMLVGTTDGGFMVPWTLKSGGRAVFSMPRAAVFRSFILNHAVHHRGQLSVYLRLCDVPLPNIYGPTADSD